MLLPQEGGIPNSARDLRCASYSPSITFKWEACFCTSVLAYTVVSVKAALPDDVAVTDRATTNHSGRSLQGDVELFEQHRRWNTDRYSSRAAAELCGSGMGRRAVLPRKTALHGRSSCSRPDLDGRPSWSRDDEQTADDVALEFRCA